jgi:hypothetical protein
MLRAAEDKSFTYAAIVFSVATVVGYGIVY